MKRALYEIKKGIAKREARGLPFSKCHVFMDLTHPKTYSNSSSIIIIFYCYYYVFSILHIHYCYKWKLYYSESVNCAKLFLEKNTLKDECCYS